MEANSLTTENFITIILEAINTLIGNLISSIDNNLYRILDNIVFINSDILGDKYFNNIFGTSSSNGILLISNSLLFGFLLYFAIKYLLSHLTYVQIESPIQFIFKLIIVGICMNSSYFILEQLININSYITQAILGIGEELFHHKICFSELISSINTNISIDTSSIDVFTLDGIIKVTLTMSLLSLVLSYSYRYIIFKLFILITPFAFIACSLNSTSWFFKSWLRNIFSLLFIQIVVALILLLIFSIDFSANNLLIKFLYLASITVLIKANSFVREFIGGISTTLSQNVENLFNKFPKK